MRRRRTSSTCSVADGGYTCLDNNNSSADNTALELATCVSGFSTRQSLTLTAVNWPK